MVMNGKSDKAGMQDNTIASDDNEFMSTIPHYLTTLLNAGKPIVIQLVCKSF